MSLMDFEYVRSRGSFGVHAVGAFDAFLGSEREIWVGRDGSGVIRENRGPVAFFTERGRAEWDAAGSPTLEHGPAVELFAPQGLTGSAGILAPLGPGLERLAEVVSTHPRPLRQIQRYLGETVVDAELCQQFYELVSQREAVTEVPVLADQLGRVGRGLVAVEAQVRTELVFADDGSELLGYHDSLTEAQSYAPAGASVSWCAFLERSVVQHLPAEIPALPTLACEPGGSGRHFRIRPGLSVSVGYVRDGASCLGELRDQGVITAEEYDLARADPANRDPDE
jgi:hypothetical protein